jgi:hypothetical protein
VHGLNVASARSDPTVLDTPEMRFREQKIKMPGSMRAGIH